MPFKTIARLLVKMEAYENIPCLSAQLQKKLQLDYKTNITQKCQKIELYGSPTTKDLKKPHSSRLAGGVVTWRHAERHIEVQRCGMGGPTYMYGE